jgi:hypothetical protein
MVVLAGARGVGDYVECSPGQPGRRVGVIHLEDEDIRRVTGLGRGYPLEEHSQGQHQHGHAPHQHLMEYVKGVATAKHISQSSSP